MDSICCSDEVDEVATTAWMQAPDGVLLGGGGGFDLQCIPRSVIALQQQENEKAEAEQAQDNEDKDSVLVHAFAGGSVSPGDMGGALETSIPQEIRPPSYPCQSELFPAGPSKGRRYRH